MLARDSHERSHGVAASPPSNHGGTAFPLCGRRCCRDAAGSRGNPWIAAALRCTQRANSGGGGVVMKAPGVAIVFAAVVCLTPSQARPRNLTFQERVEAQQAIDRVYYSHQT